MAQFKVGDIVELKSGGPKMTVTATPSGGSRTPLYKCSWFAGAKSEESWFPPDALMPAKKEAAEGKK